MHIYIPTIIVGIILGVVFTIAAEVAAFVISEKKRKNRKKISGMSDIPEKVTRD